MLINMTYREYIISKEWRAKHKYFLREAGYRCAFTGLKVGRGKGYNVHHLHYKNLVNEEYSRDVLVSSKWFHNWIIHGILSGFKSAGKQRTPYPNQAQRIVHSWGRLPGIGKLIVLWGLLGGIDFIGASSWNLKHERSELVKDRVVRVMVVAAQSVSGRKVQR